MGCASWTKMDPSYFSGARGIEMPKGPRREKRPAALIGNAVHVMRIATGKIEETGPADDGKNKAAVELGSKGGKARAAKLCRCGSIATQASSLNPNRWLTLASRHVGPEE